MRRGTRNIVVVDAESDPETTFESLRRLKLNLKNEMGLDLVMMPHKNGPTTNYDTPRSDAVSLLKITGLPGEEPINVLYIKLSLEQAYLQEEGEGPENKYPFAVSSFQRHNSMFPHNSTADVYYNPEQYRAYRELGYTIGKNIKESDAYKEFIAVSRKTGLGIDD